MSGDDQANTELGTAADAPTEFRDPIPAEVQHAWSADDVLSESYSSRASWRRVAGVGGAIVVAAGVIAGGIVAWNWHSQPQPSQPAPVAAPDPHPEPTPSWHLDGTYRLDIRNPEGIIYSADGTTTSMAGFRIPVRSNWVAYTTGCAPAGCSALSVLLDDVTHQNAAHPDANLARHWQAAMRWNGTEWATAGDGPHGGTSDTFVGCDQTDQPDTVETWLTLSPLPDGSFQGTSHRYVMTNECGMLGDLNEVPVTATRIGDVPPGL